MKTLKTNLFRIISIALLVQFLSVSTSWSQSCKAPLKKEIGGAINLTNTSSGLGLLAEANLFVKVEHSEFKLGVVFQNEYKKISGFSWQYRYYLLDNENVNLYLHYYGMANRNINLRSEINYIFHRFNYSEVEEFEKFNTQEHYAGFGIQVKTVKNLFVDAKIGIGGYMSQVLGEDLRDKNSTSHFDNDFGVLLSVGLRYKIEIKTKKKRWP